MFEFYKYHSNGNDFIIIDDRNNKISFDNNFIEKLCSRNFSIGADGLVLLKESKNFDYKMQFFNSDGYEADMCGNALLSFTKFLYDHIEKKKIYNIETKKSFYKTFYKNNKVSFLSKIPTLLIKDFFIDKFNLMLDLFDSGVIHGVIFQKNIGKINLDLIGKEIRNLKQIHQNGLNVNFLEKIDDNFYVRTYEKGVEKETLCCSTGALAAAQKLFLQNEDLKKIDLNFKGGIIIVEREKEFLKLSSKPSFAFQGVFNTFLNS